MIITQRNRLGGDLERVYASASGVTTEEEILHAAVLQKCSAVDRIPLSPATASRLPTGPDRASHLNTWHASTDNETIPVPRNGVEIWRRCHVIIFSSHLNSDSPRGLNTSTFSFFPA
jgi:hypothetical protein